MNGENAKAYHNSFINDFTKKIKCATYKKRKKNARQN